MTPRAKWYSLAVVLKGPRLSAANKRAVKRACTTHGLRHAYAHKARAAASALSMLNAVERVEVSYVVPDVVTYTAGIPNVPHWRGMRHSEVRAR